MRKPQPPLKFDRKRTLSDSWVTLVRVEKDSRPRQKFEPTGPSPRAAALVGNSVGAPVHGTNPFVDEV
jgi:hypothetical protein